MLETIKNSVLVNQILNSIKLIEFENLFLTGGTLRNIVWNSLHSYDERYNLEDCDIIFYNPMNLNKEYEKFIEHILFDHNPKIKWSVKNQARMHLRNNHQSYNGIESALIAFPETCSAVAIGKKFEIIAPYGFIDLFNFRINPTKFCIDNEPNIFINRVHQKKWKEIWPNLILNEKIMKTIPYVENSNLSA